MQQGVPQVIYFLLEYFRFEVLFLPLYFGHKRMFLLQIQGGNALSEACIISLPKPSPSPTKVVLGSYLGLTLFLPIDKSEVGGK